MNTLTTNHTKGASTYKQLLFNLIGLDQLIEQKNEPRSSFSKFEDNIASSWFNWQSTLPIEVTYRENLYTNFVLPITISSPNILYYSPNAVGTTVFGTQKLYWLSQTPANVHAMFIGTEESFYELNKKRQNTLKRRQILASYEGLYEDEL